MVTGPSLVSVTFISAPKTPLSIFLFIHFSNAAINAFADYIKGQVLADNIVIADNDGCEIDLDDITARIKVEKV